MYKPSTVISGLTLLSWLLVLSNCAVLQQEKNPQLLSSQTESYRAKDIASHSKEEVPRMAKLGIASSLSKSRLTLHEPVNLIFTIKNRLTQPIKINLGQDRKQFFLFTITQPNGSSVTLPQLKREGISVLSSELSLEPGETYTQKLLLNEWFDFPIPGKYRIQVQLAKPIQTEEGASTEEGTRSYTILEVEPRNAESLKLVCATLSEHLKASTSYEEAAEAANELSYIKDPVAVPYLKEALMSEQMVESIAVKGLERIGGDEAVEALTSAQKGQSSETTEESIKPALSRMKNQSKRTAQEQN